MSKRIFLIADWVAFLVVPCLLLLAYLTGDSHLYKDRGDLAMKFIYVIMFMKPIIVIVGHKPLFQLLPYRRQLGVIATWLAVFHTIGLVVAYDLRSISDYLTTPRGNTLFVGALAMIGMLILGLTSNFWSIKFFGKNWKRIQRLAYPTLFLGKLHGELSRGTIVRGSDTFNTAKAATVSVGQYIPTILLFVIFVGLKYRQHKVQTRQWKSLGELYA